MTADDEAVCWPGSRRAPGQVGRGRRDGRTTSGSRLFQREDELAANKDTGRAFECHLEREVAPIGGLDHDPGRSPEPLRGAGAEGVGLTTPALEEDTQGAPFGPGAEDAQSSAVRPGLRKGVAQVDVGAGATPDDDLRSSLRALHEHAGPLHVAQTLDRELHRRPFMVIASIRASSGYEGARRVRRGRAGPERRSMTIVS